MRAFVREVLHSIQGHLAHIATHPPTEGAQGTSKAGGPGGAKITTMGAFLPATDDRYGVQSPVVLVQLSVGSSRVAAVAACLESDTDVAAQHVMAQHSAAQHSAAHHSTAQHHTAQHSIIALYKIVPCPYCRH